MGLHQSGNDIGEERFIDTGEEWSADAIETYGRGFQRGNDYSLLLNFTHSCQMINISRGNEATIELNKRLEEKGDVLMALPPYVTHAGQWEAIYSGIQTLIEKNIGDVDVLKEIATCVDGKWGIMIAREEFKKNTKNALAKQEKSFVNGADWNEEQIQEYRESPKFALDYTFLINLYVEMKAGVEFNKSAEEKDFLRLSAKLEENFGKLTTIPVHALDKSFRWNSLYSMCYKLSEKLPEDKRTIVDSLVFLFDQNGEYK